MKKRYNGNLALIYLTPLLVILKLNLKFWELNMISQQRKEGLWTFYGNTAERAYKVRCILPTFLLTFHRLQKDMKIIPKKPSDSSSSLREVSCAMGTVNLMIHKINENGFVNKQK